MPLPEPSEAPRVVSIRHLGRIEGHGGIAVKVAGRAVKDVALEVFEGSRYYEGLLVGRGFLEVQGIISRVCAICSAGHTVAALSALEDALGITPSERVHHLRGLLVLGSTIESHALHVFALALPDFVGVDSVMALSARYPEEVAFALRLKQLGNRIQELVGGRAVHPINTLVGGFGRLPGKDALAAVREQLVAARDPLARFVELAATLPIPDWPARPTVHVALEPYEDAFRFRGRTLCTSRGDRHPVDAYRRVLREFTVEHSHAKHATLVGGGTYRVGSLARLALWGRYLEGRAREASARLLPAGAPDNVLFNTWAQLVELVHCVDRGVELCDVLLALPPADRETASFDVRAGRGVAALEVPRGTLIHEYAIDDLGVVLSANVITPTAQNLANLEGDMRQAAERLLSDGASDDALARGLEMVARAYDPCVSCSVHVVREA